MKVVSSSILTQVYKKRKKDVHKGHFGHLLVVGGSKLYTGAPGLVARAALRSGVDLVTVVAPRRAADAIAESLPDFITWPLSGDYMHSSHLKDIRELFKEKKAFVIGNGMWGYMFGSSSRKTVSRVIHGILREVKIPGVLDAEAIYALKTMPKRISLSRHVLTPHGYEFCRLVGVKAEHRNTAERVRTVREAARKLGCVILLKGSPDVISDGEEVALNETGNVYMTKAGTGDVLAGVVGSLLAQGVNSFLAAQAGAYIVGRAGDRVAKMKKQGLLASEVVEEL